MAVGVGVACWRIAVKKCIQIVNWRIGVVNWHVGVVNRHVGVGHWPSGIVLLVINCYDGVVGWRVGVVNWQWRCELVRWHSTLVRVGVANWRVVVVNLNLVALKKQWSTNVADGMYDLIYVKFMVDFTAAFTLEVTISR